MDGQIFLGLVIGVVGTIFFMSGFNLINWYQNFKLNSLKEYVVRCECKNCGEFQFVNLKKGISKRAIEKVICRRCGLLDLKEEK